MSVSVSVDVADPLFVLGPSGDQRAHHNSHHDKQHHHNGEHGHGHGQHGMISKETLLEYYRDLTEQSAVQKRWMKDTIYKSAQLMHVQVRGCSILVYVLYVFVDTCGAADNEGSSNCCS
jgi:hypothetical protein